MVYYCNMKFCLLFIGLFCCQLVHAQPRALIPGDFADPSIVKAGNRYYAVGTSSEWAPHFPIYISKDLQNWKQTGFVFDKAPEWTSGSFWAPEYYYQNNTYYIYYTARRKSDNISCIGVATSKYPDRGFQDQGVVVSFGKEAIDAFVYNDNGQLYITFKAYGLDKRPIEILGSKLSADGLRMEGEVFSLLKDDKRLGMEGQSILKKGNYYYLFYSAGACCGRGCNYNVRVARAENFKGPYEDYAQNPILDANEAWKCPGHGTFVDDNMYIYHAYNKKSHVFTGREGMMAELVWPGDGDWPSFVSQPVNNSAAGDVKGLAGFWQWDFRNSMPDVKISKKELSLSGTSKQGNQTGIVLTVRPVSDAFDVLTTVKNSNAALKGLAFYGDVHAAVGVGVVEDTVEFWMVKGDARSVLAKQAVQSAAPVQLKLSMHADATCEVFYRQNDAGWEPVAPGMRQDISFLPQWDRSPRPGLHYKGPKELKAVFSGFEVVNR